MFKFNNISINFHNKILIENTNIELQKGNLYCLVGKNGSGKSSVFNYLKKNYHKIYDIRLLPQSSTNNVFNLNVYDTLKAFCQYEKIQNFPKIIEKYLKLCKLENYRNQNLSTMSGGEKQRVYIAQILLGKSEVLLLDEAFANLDINFKLEFVELLKLEAKERKISIILIEHDLRFVRENFENILFCQMQKKNIELINNLQQFDKLIEKEFTVKYNLSKNEFFL